MAHVRDIVAGAVATVLTSMGAPDVAIVLETPPDPKLGDLSTPACMSLARALKRNPRAIATDVQERLAGCSIPFIRAIEIAGPGFLNFFLDWDAFTGLVHDVISAMGVRYGIVTVGNGKKVIVEHTSANPNKPIHLGTARCAVLGDVAGRLLRMAGYTVEIVNYVDDLGRQVAVMLHGYRHFKDQVVRAQGDKDDYFLGLVYVKGAEDIEARPDGEDVVRGVLHQMEDPSTGENELAKQLVNMALKGQLESLWSMNIFYDLLVWERHIITSGLFQQAIDMMMGKNPGACYKVPDGEDKDCIVLDMSSFGDKYAQDKKPYKILVRSNGVSTYTGKDIAFQMWKFGEASGFFTYTQFIDQPNGQSLYTTGVNEHPSTHAGAGGAFAHADRAINVIGQEQKFPQEVVKASMKVLGFDDHFENSQHLSFKHVWLPGQKFSGRKGTWIGYHADAAIDRAIEKASDIIKEQHPAMPDDERRELARVIGTGSVKFYLLKFDLEKDITINWDDLLNFEGDACPYVQYSVVRANSILNKAVESGIALPGPGAPVNGSLLSGTEERALSFSLARLPSVVESLASSLAVNLIPTYALEVADRFNKFYHACPVLRSDVPEPLRLARMALVQDTVVVLRQVLGSLMGIEIPARM